MGLTEVETLLENVGGSQLAVEDMYLDLRRGWRYRFRSQWVAGETMRTEGVTYGETRPQNGIVGGRLKLSGFTREEAPAKESEMNHKRK